LQHTATHCIGILLTYTAALCNTLQQQKLAFYNAPVSHHVRLYLGSRVNMLICVHLKKRLHTFESRRPFAQNMTLQCISIYSCGCLSVCACVYVSVTASAYSSVCARACPVFCALLSVGLFVLTSLCLCACVHTCMCVSLRVCMCKYSFVWVRTCTARGSSGRKRQSTRYFFSARRPRPPPPHTPSQLQHAIGCIVPSPR